MIEIFAALIIMAVAISLLLVGFRYARTIIPLWGFVAGFLLGGALVSDLSNAQFLGTGGSIFIGLVVGGMAALVAYLYYGLAVVVLAGGIGYWLGSGFLLLLGFKPGTVSAVGGLVIGIVFALVTLLSGASKYAIIVLTSLAGAISLIGAGLVLFNRATLEALSYISVGTGVASSWLWLLTAIAFTAIGISVQTLTTPGYECEKWIAGSEEDGSAHHPHTPTTRGV